MKLMKWSVFVGFAFFEISFSNLATRFVKTIRFFPQEPNFFEQNLKKFAWICFSFIWNFHLLFFAFQRTSFK